MSNHKFTIGEIAILLPGRNPPGKNYDFSEVEVMETPKPIKVILPNGKYLRAGYYSIRCGDGFMMQCNAMQGAVFAQARQRWPTDIDLG